MKRLIAAAMLLVMILSACGTPAEEQAPAPGPDPAPEGLQTTQIAVLKGATAIGLVKLMADGEADGQYHTSVYVGAEEIVPLLAKEEVDIALIPANLAATLYQKTEGGITVLGINTMGVLHVVTADPAVQSITDLAGKTVYMTGKGTVPEYTVRWLLANNGLSEDAASLEFLTEPTEVVSRLSEEPDAVGILPQPFATVALTQNDSLRAVMNLGDVWDETAQDGSRQVTGVTVVRTAFLQEHPDVVEAFLRDQEASVDYVNTQAADAALLVEQFDIVKAQIAEKAIPACQLVHITGADMKRALEGYLQALFEMAPESIGGTLPDEAFYYMG